MKKKWTCQGPEIGLLFKKQMHKRQQAFRVLHSEFLKKAFHLQALSQLLSANMSTCFGASPGPLKRKMKFLCQSPHSFLGKAEIYTREALTKRATRHWVLLQLPLHQSSVFLPFPQLLCGALKETLQKSVTCPSISWAGLKLESHLPRCPSLERKGQEIQGRILQM